MVAAGCLLALLAAGYIGIPTLAGPDSAKEKEAFTREVDNAHSLSRAFQQVAKSVGPAVVNIKTERVMARTDASRPGQHGPLFREGPLRDLFKGFPRGGPFQHRGAPAPHRQRGMGSGVIVSKDGYVLTNNHVVAGAADIRVRMRSGESCKAKLIGADPKTDLAVLKMDAKAKDLPVAELGDSEKLAVGEWVLAIGAPFGLEQTVTAGIVSAKGRANMGITDYEDFIQTDAAINPGNSGGPLVDLSGRVVGINTAIASRSGGYQGIGFAIPVTMAKRIMDSLIADGRVQRGWLGVIIQDLDPGMAKSFGYEDGKGVLIGDVKAGGPAAKAGMEGGDILARYGGELVRDVNHLRNLVAGTQPRSLISMDVFRDGKWLTLKVRIGEMEARRPVVMGASEGDGKLGLRIEPMTDEAARRLGLQRSRGVLVAAVKSGSPAEKAGVKTSDAILSVNGTRVNSLEEFKQALSKNDLKEGVRFRLRSKDGVIRYVFLKA
jgi:serine protease Do